MNAYDAKTRGIEVASNFGMTGVERMRLELLAHLDFWKPQVTTDPAARARFEMVLPDLEEMSVAWRLKANDVMRYLHPEASWAIFPVILSQVRASILEHVGLKKPEPTLEEIAAAQPTTSPDSRVFYMDLVYGEPRNFERAT